MPQQRSSTAVWIALALIAASIVCVAISFKQIQGSHSPRNLSIGIYVLYIAALIAPIYFTARLFFAGLMIVVGKPINRTVAWHSATEAIVHCVLVLAVVAAAIFLAPPQGFALVAIGLGLALVALFVMGQYPNLAETQGWEVGEPDPAPAPRATRAKTPSAPSAQPAAAPVRPVVTAPLVAPPIVAPPISVEAPRGASGGDEREPSLLR